MEKTTRPINNITLSNLKLSLLLLDTVIEDLENYFTGLSKYELFDCFLRLKRAREELDELEGDQ